MSTIPVGSRWVNQRWPALSATVIHMIDHEISGKRTRHIIYEGFVDDVTCGLAITPKSRFEADFARPEVFIGDDVP